MWAPHFFNTDLALPYLTFYAITSLSHVRLVSGPAISNVQFQKGPLELLLALLQKLGYEGPREIPLHLHYILFEELSILF